MTCQSIQKIIPLLCVTFFLFGCVATTKGYQQVLDTWIGSTEQSLVQSWGPPDNVYENNGMRILTYDQQKTTSISIPQYQTTTHQGTVYGGGTLGSYSGTSGTWVNQTSTAHHRCKTNFTTDERGVIRSYSFEGNSCRSQETGSENKNRKVRCFFGPNDKKDLLESECENKGGTFLNYLPDSDLVTCNAPGIGELDMQKHECRKLGGTY